MTASNKPTTPMSAERQRRARELNARQRAYVIWKATPEMQRSPKTQKDFAEAIGVTEQAVWKWSKDPRIIEAIRFVTLQNVGEPTKVSNILDMIYEVALAKKDPKVAEVWLKATGVYSQFGRTADFLEMPDDAEGDSFEDYSIEELERLRAEALAQNLETVTIQLAERKLNQGPTPESPQRPVESSESAE